MRHLLPPPSSYLLLRVRRDRDYRDGKQILLELAMVGNPADRGMVAVSLPPPGGGETTPAHPGHAPEEVIARWGLEAREVGVPIDPAELARLKKQISPLLSTIGRGVGGLFSWIPADTRTQVSQRVKSGFEAAAWRYLADLESSGLHHAIPVPRLSLPARVADPLRSLCKEHLKPGDALWLQIERSASYLPLFPWERLLGEHLKAPILRLAYHAVQAQVPHRALRVVVSISAPSATQVLSAATLAGLLGEVRDGLPAGSVVHVFADLTHYEGLSQALAEGERRSGGTVLELHDPREARSSDTQAGPCEHEHPWVRWMLAKLENQAVDLVHWISPGVLGADRGRFAVLADPATGPTPRSRVPALPGRARRATLADAVRLVSADEMHGFLNQLGAWGAVLSSPPDEVSRLALRFIIDDLARLRPGPCALHEISGQEPGGLRLLYRFLTSPETVSPPTSHHLQVYCHPAAMEQSIVVADVALQSVLNRFLATTRSGDRPPEQWVASGQRLIEQSVADCAASDESTPLGEAARRGKEKGIAFVSQLIAEAALPNAGGDA